MAISKRLNWSSVFLFLFLIVFPFGQIIRIGIVQPLDLIAGAAAFYTIFNNLPRPATFKYLENFLIIAGLSWLFSIYYFPNIDVLYGLLYFVRLSAYFYFAIYVWNFAKRAEVKRKLLVNSLLAVSIASAVFGWIQFFSVPSLKPFFVLGWDEHLFRLVGTFLDPTFLGLIIVFGLIISMIDFVNRRSKISLFIIMFLLGSLAFTYSRASYLAFFIGAVFVGIYKKKIMLAAFIILSLLTVILLLPTSANHILSFTRTFSAAARVENYRTTFEIFSKSPIFGIGYDNMCVAYRKFIGVQSFSSHACSGSDSSLLFILATTGMVGFIVFIYSLVKVGFALRDGPHIRLLAASFAALLVHSLFSNSLVYSWIIGWMAVLLGVSLGSEVER